MRQKFIDLITQGKEKQACAMLAKNPGKYVNIQTEDHLGIVYLALKHGLHNLVNQLILVNAKVTSANPEKNIRLHEESLLETSITQQLNKDPNDTICDVAICLLDNTNLTQQPSLKLLQAKILTTVKIDDDRIFIYLLKIFCSQHQQGDFFLDRNEFPASICADFEEKILQQAIAFIEFESKTKANTSNKDINQTILANIIIRRLHSPALTDTEHQQIAASLNYFTDQNLYTELKYAHIVREKNPDLQQAQYLDLCIKHPEYTNNFFNIQSGYWRKISAIEQQANTLKTENLSLQDYRKRLQQVFLDKNSQGKLVSGKPMTTKFQHEAFFQHIVPEYYFNVWKQSKTNLSVREWWQKICDIQTDIPIEYLTDEQLATNHKVTIKNGIFLDPRGQHLDTTNDCNENLADFVWRMNKELYYSDPNDEPEEANWQHSSLAQGRPTKFAGEMQVINGHLHTITLRSGHYEHPLSNVKLLLKYLQQQGVDLDKVVVSDIHGNNYNAIELIPKKRGTKRHRLE